MREPRVGTKLRESVSPSMRFLTAVELALNHASLRLIRWRAPSPPKTLVVDRPCCLSSMDPQSRAHRYTGAERENRRKRSINYGQAGASRRAGCNADAIARAEIFGSGYKPARGTNRLGPEGEADVRERRRTSARAEFGAAVDRYEATATRRPRSAQVRRGSRAADAAAQPARCSRSSPPERGVPFP